ADDGDVEGLKPRHGASIGAWRARPLHFEDAAGVDLARHEMPKRKPIAAQPPLAVDPGLGPERLGVIGHKVAHHQQPGMAEAHRALARKVDGIGNLGITQAEPAQPAGFDTAMDAREGLRADNAAALVDLRGEIHILLPTIERQALVEARLAYGAGAIDHVAAI